MLAVRAYQLGVMLGGGLLPLLLERRAKAGREDPARLDERKARNMAPRPAGNLVWLHAASVGETRSALPLLADFLAAQPDTHILITTGTRTSATLVGQLKHASFPDIDRLTHQYLPLDRPLWVKRFLDHWSPQLAIFVESELWPNLLLEMRRRNIPATLINGRLSEKSFKFWRRARKSAHALFGCFDMLLAQDDITAQRWQELGLKETVSVGNLKLDAPPLNADASALNELRDALHNRPVWVAASTHSGEEDIIAECHRALCAMHPDLLCILVPRHPERGAEIAELLSRAGEKPPRRSAGTLPCAKHAFYIGDTLGEMGLYYRLGGLVFMGGSLVPHGGQNPLEAARLDNAILSGPHIGNFSAVYDMLDAEAGLARIGDARELVDTLDSLLRTPAKSQALAENARACDARQGGARARTLAVLNELLARSHA